LELTPESKLPDYENPPVAEVVTGVYFKPVPLQLPHFGLLWDEFRAQYPKFEEAQPLVPDFSQGDSPEFPMPRVWFVTEDDTGIVQVQRGYFMTNWRRVKPSDAYPRYQRVIELYRERLARFEGFLKKHDLPPTEPVRYEMTYVNHIFQGDGWEKTEDLGLVLPDLSWRRNPGRFLTNLEGVNSLFTFSLPDGAGSLRASVRSARRRSDNRPLLNVELTVRGMPRGGGDAWNWFALAREWIVRGFADLTSEDVQRAIWRRVR
jgi:uncharacterized protein (TIGR04255 family)